MNFAVRCGCMTLALLVGVSASRASDLPTSDSRLIEESATVLRLNLGAGLTYEFQTLNSVLLTGSGPSAEINLEFVTAKRRSWGLGARYRRISLLGPDVSAAGATIEQISNIDYNLFLRFGWLDLYGGVEQFTGKMFVIDSGSSGSKVLESKLVPMGGIGLLLYSSKGLKGRFQAMGSYGTVYGYSMNSVRFNASIQTSFP